MPDEQPGAPSALTVRTEPLGGGALARAAVSGALPDEWFVRAPADADGWRTRAIAVRDAMDETWATRLEPALAASGAAAARLARVAGGKGIVVTTGQQPGLFGGPIYTWSKALSALALADAIEAATGIPTAPVFWAATDDADFAEASVTHVAVPGGIETLRATRVGAEGTIMAHMPLGDVRGMVPALRRGAGSASHAAALDAATRAYQPDATVGGAYVALLRTLLEPLGIAVLDAAHEATRRATDPFLRRALAGAERTRAALAERDAAVQAAGLDVQVREVPGLSLVFDGLEGTKRRIPLADAARASSGARIGELGANVLLRPVVERCILPTVAYLAGPGEIAYFAQATAVADALGLERPLALPRWSGTIEEPHVARILARLGIAPDDLRDPHAAEVRLTRASLPGELRATLDALRRAVKDGAATLAQLEAAAHLIPVAAVEGFRGQLEHRIDRLERRYVASARQRESDVLRDVATARASLWPLGARQERTLNFLPLLARYGDALPQRMLAGARAHAQALVGAGRGDASAAQAPRGAGTAG